MGYDLMVPGTQNVNQSFNELCFFAFFFFFLRKANVDHYCYGPIFMLACFARNLIALFISESKCLLHREGKISPVGKLAQFPILASSVPSIKKGSFCLGNFPQQEL